MKSLALHLWRRMRCRRVGARSNEWVDLTIKWGVQAHPWAWILELATSTKCTSPSLFVLFTVAHNAAKLFCSFFPSDITPPTSLLLERGGGGDATLLLHLNWKFFNQAAKHRACHVRYENKHSSHKWGHASEKWMDGGMFVYICPTFGWRPVQGVMEAHGRWAADYPSCLCERGRIHPVHCTGC